MGTLFIILGVLTLLIGLILLFQTIKINGRKKEFKDWVIGDLLILNSGSGHFSTLTKNGKDFAILKGWTEYDLYIDCHAGYVSKVSWDVLKTNKSALWRRNYDEAKKVMGVDPGFSREVRETENNKTTGGKTYDGKVIELLSEIECQVYLKKAIEEEDYTTAELIRKRMEKFR